MSASECDMGRAELLPCKMTSESHLLFANPCSNPNANWRGPKPWGRQCGDANSLQE